MSAWTHDAPDFLHPRVLQRFGKVREHRQRVDDRELPIGERQRRRRHRQTVGPGFKKLPVRVGELGRPEQITSAARDAEKPRAVKSRAQPGAHVVKILAPPQTIISSYWSGVRAGAMLPTERSVV